MMQGRNRSIGMRIGGRGILIGLLLLGVVSVLTGTAIGAKIVGWGSNLTYEGNYAGQATPPEGNDFVAIAVGRYHSLALRANGSIVGWGWNEDGQATPPSGNDFRAISAGYDFSLALRADGSIVGWGSNLTYEGNYAGQATPPEGNDFVAIAAGDEHGLSLRANGSIVTWGDNYWGESTPQVGNDYVAIAGGGDFCLALRVDGSIVSWGRNTWGQATPPAGEDFVAIAAGYGHSLALRADGSIVSWGWDESGQATPPDGNDYVAISAGLYHSLALRSDGSIVGWGNNDYGQATPPAGNDFFAIAAGGRHGLALQKVRATSPTPADASEDIPSNTVFKWVANEEAQSHDVYLGTDRNAVANATTSSPEFQGSVAESSFGPVSLKGGATYFWRIDTILPSETYKGNIWQFTTLPACYHTLTGDLNQDCSVNLLDLAIVSEEWMRSEPAMLIARFTLKSNPKWLTQGRWQYGSPMGTGGTEFGNPDPTSGYTGISVYGVNLSGDYDLMIGPSYALTAGPISCVDFPVVTLKFARWLNTDAPEYVLCKVEASSDNTTWQMVWTNPSALEDNAWTIVEYDISSIAGSQPSVYLRWTYQVLSARAFPYSGWNIDDIELLGTKMP
jgi:hypothetical protein